MMPLLASKLNIQNLIQTFITHQKGYWYNEPLDKNKNGTAIYY